MDKVGAVTWGTGHAFSHQEDLALAGGFAIHQCSHRIREEQNLHGSLAKARTVGIAGNSMFKTNGTAELWIFGGCWYW